MRHPRVPLALSVLLTAALTPELHAQSSVTGPPSAQRLFEESPSVWFEEYFSTLQVAPDGRKAIYASPFAGRLRLLDLSVGRELKAASWPGLTNVQGATFGPGGEIILFGTGAGKPGWFQEERGKPVRLSLPPDATSLQWSPDGRQVAYVRAGVTDSVFAGPLGQASGYPIVGTVTGLSWLPDGSSFVVLAWDARGSSTLSRIEPKIGRVVVMARDLDAPTFTSPIPLAPDGRHAYVALATQGAPRPDARHQPYADRQLGIYEVDMTTGARHPIVPAKAGGDAYAPWVAAGYLYWTRAATDASIVVVPVTGGDAHVLARGAMVPSWRPDSRQIGFTYGDWRWADWALNWDGGVVDVDARGRATSALQPLIVGYHEDFQPVWSPHGRWIAYHSHRTATPVPSYAGRSEADDIWLRRVGAPPRDTSEIRLTNFGSEANSPDWSRDGTRLLFTSYERGDHDGASYPFVVTIDTVTGRALRQGRMTLPRQIHKTTWVAWSPVSDDIAVEEDQGDGRHALWIVATTGAAARKVVEYPQQTWGGVSWTPDGRTLVYSALTGGRMQLFAVRAAGGTPRQLTHDSANIFTPRVSSDGRFIAATRISHRKEIWRLPLGK